MQDKLDRIDALLQAGFDLHAVESDQGTLDVRLRQGPVGVTVRFDRDEVRRLWPRLFPPTGPDAPAPVHPLFDRPDAAAPDALADRAAPVAAALVHPALAGTAASPLVPRPYGLDEVAEFLRRDARAATDQDER